MKNLIIVAHPDLSNSIFNKNIIEGLSKIKDFEILDLYKEYRDKKINLDIEVKRISSAEIIILQFPMNWYGAPSLMKEYQDKVFTAFLSKIEDISKLEGKKLLISVTVGRGEETYSSGGRIGISIEHLLLPFKALSKHFNMDYLSPVISYGCHEVEGFLSPAKINRIVNKHLIQIQL